MKKLLPAIVSVCFLAVGCAKLDEKFTLNADGSGSLSIQVELIPQAASLVKSMVGAGAEMAMYIGLPPVPATEAQIRALGSADVVVKDARVEDLPGGGKRITAAVEFKDITKFARSKFAKFFAFMLDESEQEGKLEFRSSPLGIANLAESFSEEGFFDAGPEETKAAMAAIRLFMRGFTYRLEVNFPGKIVSASTKTTDGNKAVWSFEVDNLENKDLLSLMPTAVLEGGDLQFELPIDTMMSAMDDFEEDFMAEGKEQGEKIPPQPAGPGFAAELSQLSFNKQVELKGGKPSKVFQMISAALRVSYPDNIVPVSYSNLTVEEAVSDTGENVASERDNAPRDYDSPIYQYGEEDKGSFIAHVGFGKPAQSIRAITSMRGTIEFKYAATIKTVTVQDAGKWVGKKIDLPELAGLEITLVDMTETSVTLSASKAALPLLKSVKFKDAAGNELEAEQRGYGGANRSYSVELPKDGTILLEIGQDVKNVLIPFEQKNISLEPEPEKLPF